MSFGQHVRVFICVVIMGVLVGFVLNAEDEVTDNVYIHAVKDGMLTNYEEVRVEEAFNQYFTSPYWCYYEARSGEHVVELSGEAIYKGVQGETYLQFILNEDATEFRVGALKFNGIVQDKDEKWQLVEAVYADWRNRQVVKHLPY
ncbi:hypothetical protein [Solibacillus sp. FSL H8-0538]|uniref:hypothetical protein n=1 Tax=Solibacillus sp. FSL H8-0538 TaxID=2921400 RepID=UPI0030F86677